MYNHFSINTTKDDWSLPALAPCYILFWIGIYLCFTIICGVVFNIIILCILLKSRYRRTPIDVFIIALCTVDLLGAILGIPLPLTSNLACRWLYGKYLCFYEGFIAYCVGMIGLYLLTALSLNRYWKIVTPNNEQFVTFQTSYMSVVLSVIGGLFWGVTPIFGWNSYKLEGVRTSCSIYWQDRSINVISYNICMFIFAYFLPMIVMIYCNTCIYLKVRNVTRSSSVTGKNSRSLQLYRRKHRIERRMAKTIIIIIATFITAWTPYAIVAFISTFFSPKLVSPLGGTLPAIFAKSSVYFNPLVYILSNSSIRSKLFHRE